jgi:hypothetical protein
MDARLLTRCTSTALVVVAGMGAGHLLMPVRAGASVAARAGFVVVVALAGAVAAARERTISAEYRGAPPGAVLPWVGAGAALALVLAGLAWYLVHG